MTEISRFLILGWTLSGRTLRSRDQAYIWARVMARVGLGVWPRWLGFTMADPTPLCNGEKAYFTRLWVPLTERSQLSTTTRKECYCSASSLQGSQGLGLGLGLGVNLWLV